MPVLPAESDFTGTGRTNAEMRITHAALHAYLTGLLGADGAPGTALATLGALTAGGHLTRTAATTLQVTDRGKVVTATSGTWALTLPLAADAGAGWACILRNTGSGTITLTRAGSDLIDGVASMAVVPGAGAIVMSTGSAWRVCGLVGAPTSPVVTRAGLLGPVSQSGGVPTGAVIERGANANGDYVRFADGTQICTRILDLDGLSVNVASGALFRSDNVGPYSFPASFAGGAQHAEAVLHKSDNIVIRGNSVGVRLRRAQTSAGLAWEGISVFCASSATGTPGEITRLSLFAIGRWFI